MQNLKPAKAADAKNRAENPNIRFVGDIENRLIDGATAKVAKIIGFTKVFLTRRSISCNKAVAKKADSIATILS